MQMLRVGVARSGLMTTLGGRPMVHQLRQGQGAMARRPLTTGEVKAAAAGIYEDGKKVFVMAAAGVGVAALALWSSGADEADKAQCDSPAQFKKRIVVLGSGWAAVSFLKKIDKSRFDVTCISPRNYFLMTPLLPSVTVGTVETRTVIEPVRSLVGGGLKFLEAECMSIDPRKKVLTCRLPSNQNTAVARPTPEQEKKARARSWFGGGVSPPTPPPLPVEADAPMVASSSRTVKDSARSRPPFDVEYDILVVAVGCDNNTFNIPGVKDHAHFLKELPDAQRIRHAISDCFESAALPNQTEEERKRLLRFVVVGGGPTGVEYAAELADLLRDDFKTHFGRLAQQEAKVTVIEALDHVLSMMDKKLQVMTEENLTKQNIEVLSNTFVKAVKQKEVVIQRKGSSELESLPCALVVWATGIKPREFAQQIRKSIGIDVQHNSRGILTDAYMKVKGAQDMYAVGDCATIDQTKMLDHLTTLFQEAEKTAKGQGVTIEDLREFLNAKSKQFPQLEFLVDQVSSVFSESDENKDGKLDLGEFKKLLEKTDFKVRALPATAQVANQQGKYLANALNTTNGIALGSPLVRPFNYRHLGSLAYIGGESAVADFTGVEKFLNLLELGPMGGWGTWLVWRGFYLTEMFTLRTKLLLASDWVRVHIFGRDISRY